LKNQKPRGEDGGRRLKIGGKKKPVGGGERNICQDRKRVTSQGGKSSKDSNDTLTGPKCRGRVQKGKVANPHKGDDTKKKNHGPPALNWEKNFGTKAWLLKKNWGKKPVEKRKQESKELGKNTVSLCGDGVWKKQETLK